MFTLLTDHPLASDSPDHLFPLGAVNDNSRNLLFVGKARARGLRAVLDLGCAGGGMVNDFEYAGCDSVGVEGSSLPRERGLGYWPLLGGRCLFTADIRHPFSILKDGERWGADLITAWEFLEHVEEDAIPGVMANVRRHLAPDGLFVASVATFPDPPRHQTVKPRDWWIERLGALGLVNDEDLVEYFAPDWVRDQGERGFHVVMRVKD